jgi:hypothetical protein
LREGKSFIAQELDYGNRSADGSTPRAIAVVPAVTLVSALVSAVALGCGTTGHDYSLPVDGDDGGGGAFLNGDASTGGALDAHIEEDHITVTIVAVNCAGAGADVQAVATGGVPPYSFPSSRS